MRKIFLTIAVFILCGCLLLCGASSFGMSFKMSVKRSTYPAVSMNSGVSLLRSPLALLFPFETFSTHEVCRRPALTLPASNLNTFRFTGMLFHTKPVGTNFMQVNESMIFQKGNSFLLLPKTFVLPVYPALQPIPRPSMNLSRPD